jgi:hypothetical protein
VCGKEFSHQGNLNKHMETHGEKHISRASKTHHSRLSIGGKSIESLLKGHFLMHGKM